MEAEDLPKTTWSILDPSTWDDRVVGLILFMGVTTLLMVIATSGAAPKVLGGLGGVSADEPVEPEISAIKTIKNSSISVKSEEEEGIKKILSDIADNAVDHALNKEDVKRILYDIADNAVDHALNKEDVKSIVDTVITEVLDRKPYMPLIYDNTPSSDTIELYCSSDNPYLMFKHGGVISNKLVIKDGCLYYHNDGSNIHHLLTSTDFGKMVDEMILGSLIQLEDDPKYIEERIPMENWDRLKKMRPGVVKRFYDDASQVSGEKESEKQFNSRATFTENKSTFLSELEINYNQIFLWFIS